MTTVQPYTTIDLIRHGEIATPGLLCAGAGEPLSDNGLAQMQALKRCRSSWDVIVSSPYVRCSKFAAQLAQYLKVQHLIEPDFQEIDFGEWTDVPQDLIWASNRQQLLQLWEDPLEFTAPYGEPMIEFVHRVQSALIRLLDIHQGKSIVLLAHAGVIRAILAHVLDIEYKNTQKFNIEHAKLNRIHAYADGEFSLQRWACSATDLC